MAAQSTTLQDALAKLSIDATDQDATTNYTTAGTPPAALLSHTIKREFIILGVTPDEFFKQHGSASFDFSKIRAGFGRICEDFEDDLSMEVPSKAVEFCSKMIYEVGPEARQVKKKDGDKAWKFVFMYKRHSRLVTKVAFVSTYKADNANYTPEVTDNKIVLSVKTASLLAIIILNKLNDLSMTLDPPVALLSPLAGSVFSKDDIPAIARAVQNTPAMVVKRMNASCQSGGQYLDDSRMHVAAVAAIVATRNIKDKKMKDGIIGKTLKQYMTAKKKWHVKFFEVYAEFGHGGVPSNISPDALVNLFESIQKTTPLQAAIAARQTMARSQVTQPTLTLHGEKPTGGSPGQSGYSGTPPPKPM